MNEEIVKKLEALECHLDEHSEGIDLVVHSFEIADLLVEIKEVQD